MKIGILTFYNTLNYGAFLQMHSLSSYLANMGNEVEVIKYDCEEVVKREKVKKIHDNKSIKDLIKWLVTFRNRKLKALKFEANGDKVRLSDKTFTKANVSEIADMYDCIIVGSDQIWNNNLTRNDYTFFLKDIKCSNKLSYAASFGLNELDEDYANSIKRHLREFGEISVREAKGVEILRSMGIDSQLVLDPIFLYNRQEWNEIVKEDNIENNNKKYVLMYLMTNTQYLTNFAQKLADDNNLVLINANPSMKDLGNPCVKTASAISPFEWVKSIMDAEIVITNSFHGLAFAINLNKKFYTAIENLEQNTSSRLENLLRLTNLEYRNILSDHFILDSKIDYEKVNNTLDGFRNSSKDFLKNNLQKVEKQCE